MAVVTFMGATFYSNIWSHYLARKVIRHVLFITHWLSGWASCFRTGFHKIVSMPMVQSVVPFLKKFWKAASSSWSKKIQPDPTGLTRVRRDRRPHHPAQETLCTAFVPFLPCLERRSGPPTHRSQRRQSPRRPHRQQSVRRARKRTEKYVIVDLRTFPPKAFKPVDKNRPILT